MNPQEKAQFQDMMKKVDDLSRWMEQRKKTQLSFPIDPESLDILRQNFLSIVGIVKFTNANGLEFDNLLVQQAFKKALVAIGFPWYVCTANATDNTLTIGPDIVNNTQGSFSDDDQVFVASTDALPGGLAENIPYYVVDSSNGGKTVKLSSTSGGTAIDLTDAGSGTIFIQFFT